MRRNKDGTIHKHSLSLQQQAVVAKEKGIPSPTPRQMLLTHTQQFLGHLDWFVPRCKVADALPVVTARAALRLLIEYLEGNK